MKQGLRSVWRHKRVSVAVVITLGLALGAALAVAAVVDAVLLRPLPFPDPGRIVAMWNTGPKLPATVRAISFQDLEDWREMSKTLEVASGFTPVSATLTERGDPRRLEGMRVARDFDRVLGMRPEVGRLFVAEDFAEGAPDVVVLANGFWRREFGSRTDAIGQALMLDGRPWRIVGVLADVAMTYPTAPHDFWRPLLPRAGAQWESQRATGWLNAVGRLRPGVSVDEARGELSAVARALAERYPGSNRERQAIDLRSLKDELVADARAALWLVAAAVGALLLVAFGNVVHLLVAHAVVRQREFAVRHALGATPGRLGRQIGIEAAALGAAAVCFGLVIAPLLVEIFVTLPANALPRQSEIAIVPAAMRWGVVMLALTVAVIAWPHARLASRSTAIGAASTRIVGSRADRRVRQALIGTQVALSIVLLTGGALFVRTLIALQTVDAGFSSDNVLTMQVTPSRGHAPSAAATMQFYGNALDAIRAVPGVEAAAASTSVPYVVSGWAFGISSKDASGEQRHPVRVSVASPQHFDALRVPIIEGRPLSDDEQRGGADAVVVSRALARVLYGSRSAVGGTLDYSGRTWTIVGVVPDLRWRLDQAPIAEVYLPWHNAGQRPQAIVVRTSGDAASLTDLVGQRLRAIDPGVTIAEVSSLRERMAVTLAPQRLRAALLASLAGLAAMLAMFGVYSVTAFAVATEAREQAIRVALGETRERARRRVVGASLKPAMIGAALGVAVAWACGRFVQSFLFEMRADDPRLFAVVSVALLALTVVAAWLPASRAARLDPSVVLRDTGDQV